MYITTVKNTHNHNSVAKLNDIMTNAELNQHDSKILLSSKA